MLKNTVHELELTVTDIFDHLIHMQNIQPERFQEVFHIMDGLLGEGDMTDVDKLLSGLGVGTDAVIATKQQIKMADQKFMGRHSRMEGLEALKTEVANLKQNEAKITAFRQEVSMGSQVEKRCTHIIQADIRLKRIEMRKRDDKAQLDQLFQKFQNLHQQSPHSQDDPSISSFKIDDLLSYSNALVIAYLMQEIKPALDAIVADVDTSCHVLTDQLTKLTEQVVVRTYDMVQMTLKMNGLSLQLYS